MCGRYSCVEGTFMCGSAIHMWRGTIMCWGGGHSLWEVLTCGGDIHIWEVFTCGEDIHMWRGALTCREDGLQVNFFTP